MTLKHGTVQNHIRLRTGRKQIAHHGSESDLWFWVRTSDFSDDGRSIRFKLYYQWFLWKTPCCLWFYSIYEILEVLAWSKNGILLRRFIVLSLLFTRLPISWKFKTTNFLATLSKHAKESRFWLISHMLETLDNDHLEAFIGGDRINGLTAERMPTTEERLNASTHAS